jgi:hypothetical protein
MPFPVLRKHAEGHVTCLGSYVVVDLLERWTGDKSLRRSVIENSLDESAGDVTNGREECEGSGLKAAPSRGVRFYHAVLQRVGEWHRDTTVRAAAAGHSGSGCSGPRGGGGSKRKRCE